MKKSGKLLKCHNISEKDFQAMREHAPVKDWERGEIPYSQHPDMLWRQKDQLSFVISGSVTPQVMHGFSTTLAGEQIVVEPNPKRHKGEGDVNSYHFITITGTGDPDLPYCVRIYNYGGDLAHWPSDAKLNDFVNQLTRASGTGS
ncbi:MAG: hypothetical protein V1792_21645 [Pseudomonadota bacterium]